MGHFAKRGYAPVLPPTVARRIADDPDEDDILSASQVKAAMAKRPRFDPDIRGALEDQERRANRITTVTGPGNMPMVVAACGSCGAPGALENMHLGHRETWAAYVTEKRPRTRAAIVAAYNDLTNLKLEHSTCNVSHIFEKLSEDEDLTDDDREVLAGHDLFSHLDDDTLAELARSDIFAALRDRNEETEATEGVKVEIAGREVVLGRLPRLTRADVPVDPDDMDRPDFFDATRGALLGVWQAAQWVQDAGGGKHLRCGSCGLWGEGHAMQLGHVTDWRAYLKSFGDITARQAVLLYNDVKNLKFEHAMCNQGHEWEEMALLMMPAEQARQWAEANRLLSGTVAGAMDFRLESTLRDAFANAGIDLTAQLQMIRDALAERDDHDDGPLMRDGVLLADGDTADRLGRILSDNDDDIIEDDDITIGGLQWKVDVVRGKVRDLAEYDENDATLDTEVVARHFVTLVLELSETYDDDLDGLVRAVHKALLKRPETRDLYPGMDRVTADQVQGVLDLVIASRRRLRAKGRPPTDRPEADPVDFGGFTIDTGVVRDARQTLEDEAQDDTSDDDTPPPPRDKRSRDGVADVPRKRIKPTLIDPQPQPQPQPEPRFLWERFAQANPTGANFLSSHLFDLNF